MAGPKPFVAHVPQAKIDTLQKKLAIAEFPDELEDAKWDLGSPLPDVKRLASVWKTWDWRQAESKINQLPQFTTDIQVEHFDSLNLHFVHQKSEVDTAIPLLFVHGWPGSFLEVVKILPLLAQHDTSKPAFHVVAPSLPNFGFSQGVSKRGFGVAQYAEACHKLMLELGYTEYVTQGGDWGAHITRAIGLQFSESCKASHLNMISANPPSFARNPITALQHSLIPYTANEKEGLERTEWFADEGVGYNVLQATKPQTIGYALQDSPVALLAWIYEKLHDWTDSYPWTDDEILTWVSLYAFSRAGPAASCRIYYEKKHATSCTSEELRGYIGSVKLGLSYNPRELYIPPKTWGRTLGDVVFEADNDHGGHFYAHESPHLLVRDIQNMFGRGGGAYGVVPGKSGYSSI